MCSQTDDIPRARSTREWRDRADTPLMIELPTGDFVMGENEDDRFADDTERPAHRVNIPRGISFGVFPVTIGEFKKFSSHHACSSFDELPLTGVTWSDAFAYCKWLTALTGRTYRLPSEAEWEYACRAGSRSPFAFGDTLTVAEANFYYDENGLCVGPGHLTGIGSYPPNAFGLYDLHGNVCEWVQDTWHPNYCGAPYDGQPWTGPDFSRRVIRGGAWDHLPRLLRSARRDWHFARSGTDNTGFRVATGPNDIQ